MSSREIAELTGKDLAHVHRDIRSMLDDLKKDDPTLDHPIEEKDARGYTTCFHLSRDLTDCLLTGYSAVARMRVIRRWRELESQAATSALPNFSDPVAAARAWADQTEKALAYQAERDEAIRTKALIGSKREATAMATASAAKAEAAKLRDKLGQGMRQASVRAVTAFAGRSFDWLPMRRWCKERNIEAAEVLDPLYGTVKAWPAAAWLECHGIDLADMFD